MAELLRFEASASRQSPNDYTSPPIFLSVLFSSEFLEMFWTHMNPCQSVIVFGAGHLSFSTPMGELSSCWNRFGLCSSSKGNFKVTAYEDIRDNSVLLTLLQQFGERLTYGCKSQVSTYPWCLFWLFPDQAFVFGVQTYSTVVTVKRRAKTPKLDQKKLSKVKTHLCGQTVAKPLVSIHFSLILINDHY